MSSNKAHRAAAKPRVAKEMNLFPQDFLCPRCKCGACYPLHRRGLDWLLSPLGLRPARCMTCAKRFYARYDLDALREARSKTEAGKSQAEALKTASAGAAMHGEAARGELVEYRRRKHAA